MVLRSVYFETVYVYLSLPLSRPVSLPSRHRAVLDLLHFMAAQNYEPHSIAKTKLDPARWGKWPDDIVWKHSLATFPGVQYAFPNT